MTAPGVANRLKALAARGRFVLLDPRRTETAAIASEHHFIRPDSDAWFLLAFLQALLRLGEPKLDAYADRLANLEPALQAIRRVECSDVEVRTGISARDVERLAAEFRAAPSAVAYGRIGVSVQSWGTLCQWLLQLINLVTGNLDRAGGALVNEPAIPVTGPGTSPGRSGRWHSRVRGLPEFAGELPVGVLAEEIDTPGEGQVRALLTVAGNPVLSTPDGRRLDAALSGLDFMLSIDIYLNETTRHADLILPPASSLTQYHYDLVFNAFAVRRVARLSVPFAPRGEDERADWEIVDGLGRALAPELGREWRALKPPREEIAAGLARGGSGLDIDTLEAATHGIDLGPLRPSLLARVETADGRIECAPERLLEVLRRLSTTASTPLLDGELRLIGRRDVRSNNSWMHNAPRLVKGKLRHQLLMHPRDLGERGIASGQRVRVSSATGSIETEVLASEDLMPGVACLPHGFGHDRKGVRLQRASLVAGASYNDLSDGRRLEGGCGNAALNGIPITVERA